MSRASEVLDLILEQAGSAEPVSVVRLIEPAGTTRLSIRWRGTFHPPIGSQLSELANERLDRLEAQSGIVDLEKVVDERGQSIWLVVEVVRPKLRLLVIGAGHVGQAVALIGAMLGYQVTVMDDRGEFLSRKRFPDPRIDLVASEMVSAVEHEGITPRTAVVIVTRGHQSDEVCLKSVLRSKAGYLGMIGSRRRVLGVFKKLTSEGFDQAELARVHAPIGLKIGARTPQEIAVSILAEIIDHVNNQGNQERERRDGI